MRGDATQNSSRSAEMFPWRRKFGLLVALIFGIFVAAFVFAPQISIIDKISSGGGYLEQHAEDIVPLKILVDAPKTGAVCLDGTPPGINIDRGFGAGVNNWLIHLEGGGWCETVESCISRKKTKFGSSSLMQASIPFAGILSRNQSENPDFYNWNRVKVRYCDGGSFSGDVESEIHNGEKLFFRGQRIWEAVLSDLMASGLASAQQALLSGCSAGGLAALIHCDDFRRHLPNNATVKCLPDAGFFLDIEDISGTRTMRSFYHDIVELHEIAKNLPKDCTGRTEPSQCFFPEELIKSITTPLFVLNPTYDFWQIQHGVAPPRADPGGLWSDCNRDIFNCDSNQIEVLQGFRTKMVDALKEFGQRKDGGLFLNSCFIHCQTETGITWHSSTSPRIENKTIARAVGEWFFDRGVIKEVDCRFPCNPSCYNIKFPPRFRHHSA